MKPVFLFFMGLVMVACSAPDQNIPKGEVFAIDNIGLAGYDPVSYFEMRPTVGKSTFKAAFEGTEYHFSSSQHLDQFKAHPEKYVPLYGGWCAYAIAEGSEKVAPDPESFLIQEGRLLLFYEDWKTRLMGEFRSKWSENAGTYKEKADKNWPAIRHKEG